jgi:polygalacturonase
MLRRDFLKTSSLAMGVSAAGAGSAAPISAAKNIMDFGATPDGKTLNTKAIQRTIDEVFLAGGGLVYMPVGTFLTGGLELKSRVTLYLEAGSVLLGSPSIDDYPYHAGPPMHEDANGYHLIFAQKADDIAVCGLGTIDGQGEAYWDFNPAAVFKPEDMYKDVASGHYMAKNNNQRPSPMIEFAQCRNVRISGVTLKNSAGWTMRPIGCETVVIDGVRIRNPYHGRNTDGFDITASRNVLISNCDIITGDDAICLKSENPYGDLLPTKNITVTNCVISSASNGFKVGTATFGAFENITFSNSVIYTDDSSPFNTRAIGGINIEAVDGGSVDGVVVSNIRMQNVRAPIFIRLGKRKPKGGTFLRNILIEGVDAIGSIITSSITGVPGLRPTDITVNNCHFRTVEAGTSDWIHRDIPEVADRYPESWMMGHLPAFGFYVRHADRVRLRGIEYIADKPDSRPAIVCDDAENVILNGLELSAPHGPAPLIDLRNARRVFISGIRVPTNCHVFTQVSGAASSDIRLLGNSLHQNQRAITCVNGAAPSAIKVD